MLKALFGPKVTVKVRILGLVGDRMVHFDGQICLRGTPDVHQVLRAAGRAAGVDLLAALDAGAEPSIMLSGERLDLPADLTRPVPDGAQIAWLMPMAGG
ncbi:MAG TPA: hypothetical protein VD973_13410 [Symbiobacteriaceae bacterium]|jgi:hypothetical protein|nr:hypothetical protein [Symbiobacteriaceae bacterium]